MKWDGERDTEEYKKKCEEQRRESFEEDDCQLNLDKDVENLNVLPRISPEMSPSKPKTVARKAQENLDYFNNNY